MPHMYILECADGSYYTGSTWDLERRLWQHQNGEGANHTRKRLPIKLIYCEEYDRVDEAFYREKQVQGWSRRKKQALIEGSPEKLIEFSRNYTEYGKDGDLALIDPALASTTRLSSPKSSSAHAYTGVKQELSHFTVGQLIDVLKSMPQDLPVLTSGYENGFENFYHPEIVELKHEPENAYYDGEFQVAEDEDKDIFKAVVLRRVVRG